MNEELTVPTNVTLTAEEFKLVHNGLCNLRVANEYLSGVLNDSIMSRLMDAQGKIQAGLKGAYNQDDKDYTEKSEHYDAVAAERGFQTVWSIYTVTDLRQPHKYEGAKNLVYRTHWGTGEILVPIDGDSWVDLWAAADKAIKDSGDSHHVYIEGFKVEGDNLELRAGS